MAEMQYFEKKRKIDDLLQLSGLQIECYSPSFTLVKRVDKIDKAIDFASSDVDYRRPAGRLKDVSIEIPEISWTYYSKFSRLDFEDALIEKLELYIKENTNLAS